MRYDTISRTAGPIVVPPRPSHCIYPHNVIPVFQVLPTIPPPQVLGRPLVDINFAPRVPVDARNVKWVTRGPVFCYLWIHLTPS